MNPLGVLQRYARPVGTKAMVERCELCRVELPAQHSHLVDLEERNLCCACRPCALLFLQPGAARGRYRTVPDRVLTDRGAGIADEAWARLEIPVRLAFFFFNSRADRWVAQYPSPAGATECELPLEAWGALAEDNPLIAAAEPDVEALIAWGGRRAGTPFELFLVPISDCYALVAQVRRRWRGFEGGEEVRRELDGFFERLRQRARPLQTGGDR